MPIVNDMDFELKRIPPPKETDIWVVDNYCDYCEKEITQKQIEDGEMVIKTHHNQFDNRVYFGMHTKCFLWYEKMWENINLDVQSI